MRNLKFGIFVCLSLTLMLTSLAGVSTKQAAAQAAKPIELDFAGYWPPTNMAAVALEWWGREIEKKTGGKVKFNFYWNQSLLPVYDIPTGIGKGAAKVGAIVGAFTTDLFPLCELANSIYICPSPEAGGKALWELFSTGYAPVVDEYAKLNLKVVGVLPGATHIWTFKNKKVNYPADLKGLKIRATGRNATHVKMLGGTPVSMPPTDCYEALQRGTIDGVGSYTMDTTYTWKLYEVGKYLLCPQFGGCIIDVCAVFNMDTWNSFPKDVQKVILDLSDDLADKNRDLIMEAETKYAKTIAAMPGKELYKLTPDALQQWKDAVKSEMDDNIAQLQAKGHTKAREVFDKYIAAMKKYEKNYKWVDPF